MQLAPSCGQLAAAAVTFDEEDICGELTGIATSRLTEREAPAATRCRRPEITTRHFVRSSSLCNRCIINYRRRREID